MTFIEPMHRNKPIITYLLPAPAIICTNAEQTPTNANSSIINDTRLVEMLSISIQYIHIKTGVKLDHTWDIIIFTEMLLCEVA